VLIRREKSAVLTELPSKRRQAVMIDVPNSKALRKEFGYHKNDNIERLIAMAIEGKEADGKDKLFTMFQRSGEAKLKVGITICSYVCTFQYKLYIDRSKTCN
jgi:hypothetical protein